MGKYLKRRVDPFDILLYLLPPVIVIVGLLTVFSINGIYPFGNGTIAYGDMAQAYIPKYYHLYDALHGNAPFLYTFETGTGVSMVSNVSALSPLNIFFYFIPREMISESMSYFLMMKMALLALTTYIFINKVFKKLDYTYKVIFSVMFAFCGYVIQYYTNIMWLDSIILYPLLILAFLELVHKKRIIPYIVVLSLILIIGIYMGAMILLSLFIIASLYMIFILSKEERKHCGFYLGIGTAVSFLLSLFSILPALQCMSTSARTNGAVGSSSFGKIIEEVFAEVDMNKLLMLMGAELLFVILAKLIASYKCHKRYTLFFSFTTLALIVPIFCEGTNKLWHGGSYADFPMRFAFTLTFVLVWAASYYFNYAKINEEVNKPLPESDCIEKSEILTSQENAEQKAAGEEYELADASLDIDEDKLIDSILSDTININDDTVLSEAIDPLKNEEEAKNTEVLEEDEDSIKAFVLKIKNSFTLSKLVEWVKVAVSILLILLSTPILQKLSEMFKKYGIYYLDREENKIYYLWILSAVIFVAVFVIVLTLKNSNVKKTVIAVAVLIPMLMNSIGFIGVDKYAYVEHSPTGVQNSEKANAVIPKTTDVFSRVKNTDASLGTNYPLITNQASVSNWTALIPSELISGMNSLGYGTIFTRILDVGGTAFTDALLYNTNAVTSEKLDENLYTLKGTSNSYNYYDMNYTLPTGLIMNKSVLEVQNGESYITAQNRYYHALCDDKEDIVFTVPKSKMTVTSSNNTSVTKSVKITGQGKQALYFRYIGGKCSIKVNGKQVLVPTYESPNNKVYPGRFNNNVIYLGTFENETVEITVKSENDKTLNKNSIYLSQLSLSKLENLKNSCASASSLKVDGTNIVAAANSDSDDNIMFLPVSAINGWSCTVNGESCEIQKVQGCFIGIPLSKGENNIKLSFTPPGWIIGLIVSIGTLVLLIAFCVVLRIFKKKVQIPGWICKLSNFAVYVVLAGVIVVLYVLPIISMIKTTINK